MLRGETITLNKLETSFMYFATEKKINKKDILWLYGYNRGIIKQNKIFTSIAI